MSKDLIVVTAETLNCLRWLAGALQAVADEGDLITMDEERRTIGSILDDADRVLGLVSTQPAAGEPVAWQERASLRVEREARENGRYDFEPAPPAAPPVAAGEPVAWRFQTCSGGKWHVTTNKMHARMFDRTEDGGRVQELFTAAPPAAAHGDEAVRDVLAERQRQVDVERFTLKNDDGYGWGALALAGGCYALHAHQADELYGNAPKSWPWASHWWKPGTPRRNLVKAAALILAEIQRLDRAAMRAQGDGGEV